MGASAPASWPRFRAKFLLAVDYQCDGVVPGMPPRPCSLPAERVERAMRAKLGYLAFCRGCHERRRLVRLRIAEERERSTRAAAAQGVLVR